MTGTFPIGTLAMAARRTRGKAAASAGFAPRKCGGDATSSQTSSR